MLKLLKKWLGRTPAQEAPEPMDMLRKTGSHSTLKPSIAPPVVKPKPPSKPVAKARVDDDAGIDNKPIIEEMGPGKNVLVRRRPVGEDTGTHETLTILDDSVADGEQESGLDPYNTGQFDRSKYWDKRFLK
ncbi:MAG: hypothetical protein QNJ19_15295 [Woeseiaceae bacterium]|nr:hypothetical protein [Woeseiaceae bacterium]